jgi:hypothetical protein
MNTQPKTPYQYGYEAFENGIICAPALDSAFVKTLNSSPCQDHIKALQEWIRGWTTANLMTAINVV